MGFLCSAANRWPKPKPSTIAPTNHKFNNQGPVAKMTLEGLRICEEYFSSNGGFRKLKSLFREPLPPPIYGSCSPIQEFRFWPVGFTYNPFIQGSASLFRCSGVLVRGFCLFGKDAQTVSQDGVPD